MSSEEFGTSCSFLWDVLPNWTVGSNQKKVRRSRPKLKDPMILCSHGTDLLYGEAWSGQPQAVRATAARTPPRVHSFKHVQAGRRTQVHYSIYTSCHHLGWSCSTVPPPCCYRVRNTNSVLSSNSSLPCISFRMNTPHVHIQTAPSLPVLLHWCEHNTSNTFSKIYPQKNKQPGEKTFQKV